MMKRIRSTAAAKAFCITNGKGCRIGACDCPLWPACSYSNDLTKSNAENARIFEQGMAAALAALDNENRR